MRGNPGRARRQGSCVCLRVIVVLLYLYLAYFTDWQSVASGMLTA
jgi:hypothetical protein